MVSRLWRWNILRTSHRFFSLLLLVSAVGCSFNSPKKRFILAERLWTDKKYEAAVREFDKIVKRAPQSKLGVQALYRAAMTETVFLNRHTEAIERLKRVTAISSEAELVWSSRKQIGEILFEKLRRYAEAEIFYRELIEKHPEATEVPMFLFRVAKSQFYLWKFEESIQTFRSLHQRFPGTDQAQRALYEVGVAYYTGGEQEPGGYGASMEVYEDAIKAYQEFIRTYPRSALVAQARFGIATCFEEMDQLEKARDEYLALQSIYPSPKVIKIKLIRIEQRLAEKQR